VCGGGGGSEYGQASVEVNKKSLFQIKSGISSNYKKYLPFTVPPRLNAHCPRALQESIRDELDALWGGGRGGCSEYGQASVEVNKKSLFQIKSGISSNYKKYLPFTLSPRRSVECPRAIQESMRMKWMTCRGGGEVVPNMVRHQLNSIRNLFSK
jgi:hypothetical protein